MDEDVVVDVKILLLFPHVAPDDFRRVLREFRVVLDAAGVARLHEPLEEDLAQAGDLRVAAVDEHDVDDGAVRVVVLQPHRVVAVNHRHQVGRPHLYGEYLQDTLHGTFCSNNNKLYFDRCTDNCERHLWFMYHYMT